MKAIKLILLMVVTLTVSTSWYREVSQVRDIQYVKYGDLKNGNVIYISGHTFRISSLTNRNGTIRFKGALTRDSRNRSLKGTMYDGGTYGAYEWVRATIKKRKGGK